jgi:hypothetical protein
MGEPAFETIDVVQQSRDLPPDNSGPVVVELPRTVMRPSLRDLEQSVEDRSVPPPQGTTDPAPIATWRARRPPTAAVPAGSFRLMQQFECTVLGLRGSEVEMWARDLTNRVNPDETFVIDTSEFADSDQRDLRPGAVFYWSIGYRVWGENGPRERVSRFRLRLLPPLSSSQLKRIEARKTRLLDLFGSENNGEPSADR